MSTRILILLICAIVAGLTARQVYQDTFDFKPERSLRGYSLMNVRQDTAGEEFVARPSLKQRLIQGKTYIEDVVVLPDHELLLLIRLPSVTYSMSILPNKSQLRCVFSDKISTEVIGIEYLQGRVAVRCPYKGSKGLRNGTVSLIESTKTFPESPKLIAFKRFNRTVNWNFMVYESVVTDTDVVLFAKGVNHRQGLSVESQSLRCVFDNTVETAVSVSAQEVFRCTQPEEYLRSALWDTRVSLRFISNNTTVPSVAYYRPRIDSRRVEEKTGTESERKVVCACTMVSNVAKFVKEWVIYHSYLGVEHFFLYDNNSDDNLEEKVQNLRDFNVTRLPWPWVKTQEAGFSHCALQAKEKCQWMMFTDIDEFAFPNHWLNLVIPTHNLTEYRGNDNGKGLNALRHLISNITLPLDLQQHQKPGVELQIGQISIHCRNFGPSNLRHHPSQGVTQGYTCRQRSEQRHKSIVLLEAISPSLLNVIHHFELKPGYRSRYLKPSEAVINHYKYQAWTEFKAKFRRRVSAYVVDWKDAKNAGSQDRTPGLGNEAVEPPGWEKKFCEVNDTALRNFTTTLFSVKIGETSKMQWEL
eukprot:Gb_26835 [translate_table: standard]